ncbi:unnamed protein product [Cuscuta epithymum]|uniref:Uncharacterized protein n=1 Tax=Cuscuta epithymum TaxID=186058 RepID=A0AAV0GI05_9ASTE|nr:unnamed protein product [Cuscuta epithymum]
MKSCLLLLYDVNFFGGFFRLIKKGGESLFIPEGRNGMGIKRFLAGITKAYNLMKDFTSTNTFLATPQARGIQVNLILTLRWIFSGRVRITLMEMVGPIS